ncbi:hypothetical protein IWX90DRAFT_51682 [Phyllosticta citrichinensis]|uniref:Uncharacterized protein n=1 Tax=Phyllosticta citrichinensis TaxID=1130410 RepID=A0ABR1XIF3_9PEZI
METASRPPVPCLPAATYRSSLFLSLLLSPQEPLRNSWIVCCSDAACRTTSSCCNFLLAPFPNSTPYPCVFPSWSGFAGMRAPPCQFLLPATALGFGPRAFENASAGRGCHQARSTCDGTWWGLEKQLKRHLCTICLLHQTVATCCPPYNEWRKDGECALRYELCLCCCGSVLCSGTAGRGISGTKVHRQRREWLVALI